MIETMTRQRPRSPNDKLMRAMGSKVGSDPIPPSQYLFFLDEDQPPLQRLLAWVRSKTIRYRYQQNGRGDGRSPFCVNDKGKTLGLADLARDLGWPLANASHHWKDAETLGLVRREEKRLLLCGEVPQIDRSQPKTEVVCTNNLDPATLLKIQGWPKSRQAEFFALWQPAQEFRAKLAAQAIAQARDTCDGIDDSIRRRFELDKKRMEKRRPAEPVAVPLPLIEFVQTTSIDGRAIVQTTLAEVRTNEQNANVQTALSLLPSELHSLGAVGRSGVETTEQQEKVRAARGSELELIEKALVEIGTRLHDSPGPKLARQIHAALRGAPLQNLFLRWGERAAAITRLGLCRRIADDVGKAWQANSRERERAGKARIDHDHAANERMDRDARATLDDPKATEAERQLAHEILGTASKTAGGES